MANRLSGNVSSFFFLAATTGALSLVAACSGSSASNPPDATGGTASQGAGGGGNPAGGSNPMGGSGNGSGGVDIGAGGGTPQGGSGNDPGAGGTDPGAGGSPPASFQDLVNASDPNRNNVPGGQVCDRIATIECAGEAHCCDAPGRSFDACKGTMKQGCIDSLFLDAITANSAVSGYDPTAASAIFTEYETRASNCDTTVTAWGATVQGLRGLAPGTRSPGQSCQPPIAQIADKPTAAAFLASCTNPDTTACYPTALTWTCSPRAGQGGKCFTDANCNDGLYCTNSKNLSISGGTCQQRLGDGSPCSLQNECQSLLCKGGTCASVNAHNVFCLQ